ncbi:MAG TPA: cardiolipin synthase [Firmicutes bacterium]|jgi:cardiolipin synthase|nr:cardiolipin synthase [Bacillota bacterium]HHT43710.1 cardiolipin synthase [Bacillota bacterium]
MKKILSFLFHRFTIAAAAILAQFAALVLMIGRFSNYFPQFYALLTLLSAVAVIIIATGRAKSAYKIAWIILILLFPIFGGLFYLVLGKTRLSRRMRRKMEKTRLHGEKSLEASESVLHELQEMDQRAAGQARYIQNHAAYPVYRHEYSRFYPLGDLAFPAMLEELEKAQRFIFLEYYIIDEGTMWESILNILARKAQEGVDVRLIYDDLGCIFKLPQKYHQKLESMGIKTERFHPLTPILSASVNYRDHRKLMIIDGHTGFTGGINLADEYINAFEKYGHWKDSAFLVKGEAVWSLTVMFLAMWEYLRGEQDDLEDFRPPKLEDLPPASGFIQPFADNPLDDETVSETVYFNLINRARDYVYITTPYLILDNEMVTALTSAAKTGVDVRIITPHVPDKPPVHAVTRSYYPILLQSGVRIYEYTPGFMHSKAAIADDKVGVVGSVNLDYRSLYMAFENAVWLYGTDSVLQIKEDFLETLSLCQEVHLDQYSGLGAHQRLKWSLLRLLAPLL